MLIVVEIAFGYLEPDDVVASLPVMLLSKRENNIESQNAKYTKISCASSIQNNSFLYNFIT